MVSTALPGVLFLLDEQDSRHYTTTELNCNKQKKTIPSLLSPVAGASQVFMNKEACNGPLPVVSQSLGICGL